MATDNAAIQFDGATQLVKIDTRASIRNMGAFTRGAWFKAGSGANNPLRRAWVERQGSGARIRFSMTPYKGKLRFEFGPKDGVSDVNYDVALPNWNDDYWHHGAFSASLGGSNPTYKIILDGIKVAEGTLVLPAGVTTVDDTAPLGIYLGCASLHTSGGEVFPSDRFWNGKLDDLLTFNSVQAESDILTYVNSNDHWPSSDVDIFSNHRFTENTGTTADDADNPGWLATLYTWNGSALTASSSLWVKDRPFLGGGTADTTNPTAPTAAVSSAVTSDGFTASWTGNRINDDNIYVHHYEIQLSLTNTFSSLVSTTNVTANSNTFTGLLPNTNYWWRVRGVDEANNKSSFLTVGSAVLTSTTGDVTPPNPPTAVNATSITHNSFQINYTHPADHAGYKLDVSTSPSFGTFLLGYQNRDIGNVNTFVVSGASPLTNYYVRIRTYDSADNESTNSAVLIVQTAPPPDVSPPTQVIEQEATSVSSTAFTLNWLASTDDVGVVSYEIDIATDMAFTLPLAHGSSSYNAFNVGNVLSYRVLDALPNTLYYTRIRARDASGKVSVSSDVVTVQTPVISVEDGGLMSVQVVPTGIYGVTSASPTTKSSTLVVSGNGSAATGEVFMKLDLSTLPGTFFGASIDFTATGSIGTGFTLNITSAVNSAFDMETITWNTRPTVTGSPTTVDAFATVSKDLTGQLGKNVYLLKLSATESGSITISNVVITVEMDPISATQPREVTSVVASGEIENQITNPSFEVGATTGYTTQGSGVTLSLESTDAYSGTKSMRVVADGTAVNQGCQFTTAAYLPASNGQTWTFSVAVKSISGSKNLILLISEHDAANTLLTSSSTPITADTTGWFRYAFTRTNTNAGTTKINFKVLTAATTAATFLVDTFQGGLRSAMSAYIDGSKAGAYWTGTVNASTSKLQAAAIASVSSYVGDSNATNSAYLSFRPAFREGFIVPTRWATPVVNRSTKQWSVAVGPSWGNYNHITNPSFEIDTFGWALTGTATIARDITQASRGGASLAVTSGTDQSGAISPRFPVVPLVNYAFSARVLAPIGQSVAIRLLSYNSAGTLITTSTLTAPSTHIIGDGTFQTIWGTVAPAATSAYAVIRIEVTTPAVAGTFNVDEVVCTYGTTAPLYFDGDMLGGLWDGEPHKSATSVIFLPQQAYDIQWTYTDADGFLDDTTSTTYTHGTTYTTAAVPDNATTIQTITYENSLNSITVNVTYSGDDDNDNTATLTYTRADLSQWLNAPITIDHVNNTMIGTIEGLQAGTSYTIKLQVTDNDGVYNPVGGLIQQNVTTQTLFGLEDGTSSVRFNGFELMGGAGGFIGVTYHDSFGFPDRRLQIEDQPRRHGATQISNYWGRKPIEMKGFVSGATRADLDSNLLELKRVFSQPGILTIDTLSNKGRFYYATVENFDAPETAGENFRHLEWTVSFVCADPFAYDRLVSSTTTTGIVNNTTSVFQNEGHIDTDLRLDITTTHPYLVYVTITNNTTGEFFRPTSGIKSGDVFVMDTSYRSLTKNGIESAYTGSFLHLAPGTNEIVITLSSDYVVTTPQISMTTIWQSRYI